MPSCATAVLHGTFVPRLGPGVINKRGCGAVNGVAEFVKALGAARLAAMGAVAAGLIGFLVFLMVHFSQPQMGVLYTDLAFDDSIEIVKKLDGMNVPYEARQDGAVILVPKDQVLRLRMDMAQAGLPSGGTVGYEIFDKSGTLGATSFVQNVNRLRAIEGELARTIRTLDRVQSARVHLVLPQRQLFSRTAAEPSASIVLKVRGTLDAGQVKAIQHLAASAVEGLKPSHVSIVDESGMLLASGRGEDDAGDTSAIQERNRAFERRMEQDIEDILARVVGPDRSRVRVTAEVDYNKVTQTSDRYDPEGRVVRSTQVREESSNSTSPSGNGAVSVGNELPSANNAASQANDVTREGERKTEEIVNYEISRTTKTEVIEAGRIKRLSVAVLVDGIYAKAPNGDVTYAPRPTNQIEEISALVRTAMGFDKDRGDQLHVSNLRFADADMAGVTGGGDDSLFSLTRGEYFEVAELAVIVIISLLVLLFVVRPLVRRIVTPDDPLTLDDLTGPLPALTGPDGGAENLPALGPPPTSKAVEALKSARIDGDLQASTIREIGNVVEQYPDEAIGIVRQWIQQTA